jgi:hypothetical protein
MKKIIIAAMLGTAASACAAQEDLLTGQYGHDFTEPAATPVWEIEKDNGQYQLVVLDDEDPPQPSHEWSESERRQFWERMWWPEDSSAQASCVGNDEAVICHVPEQARQAMDELKDNQSDYFYHDAMAGVMQVQKLSH